MSEQHPGGVAGRYAYEGLDRVLHEKARLGILTALITRPEGLPFGDLKQLCSLTDGNLSRHLGVLHKAKLVKISKGFEHNRPQTTCRITPLGRRRFRDYLAQLEQVIRDALEEQAAEAPPDPGTDWPTGLAPT